jgi:hypothetical protein
MFIRDLYEAPAKRIVAVMPGGFHPFHPGHKSLYDWAVKTFGQGNVYVAATNDTAARPFPFDVKKKLAGMAGVPGSNFIQVKSPFNAMSYQDIVDDATALVFVRSEKDKAEHPKPDQTKKNGEPGYLRTYTGKDLNSSDEMGYMAYGPTINFDFSGMQIKSASELRATWPNMSDEDKHKAAALMYGDGHDEAVQLLDKALGGSDAPVEEAQLDEAVPLAAAAIWIIKFIAMRGAWPVLKWLLKKYGGKLAVGSVAVYYIDQGWDWVKEAIGEEYAQMLIDNKFEIGMAVTLILGAVALKKFIEKKGDKLVKANEKLVNATESVSVEDQVTELKVLQQRPKIDVLTNIAVRKDSTPFPLSYKDTGDNTASTGGKIYIGPKDAAKFIKFYDTRAEDEQSLMQKALKSITNAEKLFTNLGIQVKVEPSNYNESDVVVDKASLVPYIKNLIMGYLDKEQDVEKLSKLLKMMVGREIKARGGKRYTITREDISLALTK